MGPRRPEERSALHGLTYGLTGILCLLSAIWCPILSWRAGLERLTKMDVSCSPNVTGGFQYLTGAAVTVRLLGPKGVAPSARSGR